MRVLISPVGMQDPYSNATGQEGSAVTLCREIGPDVVYLLPTAERVDVKTHTAKAAQETRDWLASEMPRVRVLIKPLEVSDPTDFAQVLPEVEAAVRAIQGESLAFEHCEFHINATSGTPQIKMSLIALVASGLLDARVLEVANPETMTRRDRVLAVDVTFLVEQQVIAKVERLFSRHVFGACAEELRWLGAHAYRIGRRRSAEVFALICDAYAGLDRLQHHQALLSLQKATKAARGTREFEGVISLLERQAAELLELNRGTGAEDFRSLCDIYHNAERRMGEENYADALARCWRLVEGSLYARLRNKYGVEPTYPSQSTDMQNASRATGGRMDRGLSLMACFEGLRDALGDADLRRLVGRAVPAELGRYASLGELWEDLRQARNHSVVAHGVQPVTADGASRGLYVARQLLGYAFAGQDIAAYPFASEHVDDVGRVALAAMRGI